MDYPYADTGSRILSLRKARGLTRERLAEMADISVQFLADIEKGKKSMTVATLRRLADALTVTTDYIVNGTDAASDTELLLLYQKLSPENQRRAKVILRLLIEAASE